ncbi:MAG: hypothetical protein HFH73_02770 [Lachnospiraceae bacterium]|jgi:hypothetical protein|nr:hypothetical protein [Lachnospiraceae bacterium]
MDYKMEELLPIVSELAQKYTAYESTSITYEKAQMLMGAVLYSLDEYSHSYANNLVDKNISLKEQYHIGTNLILEKVDNIREIFNAVSFQFDDFGVKCLYDTVQKGIPQFLKWYDIKFCPQNTILTLDYPLLIDCNSLTGADAVYKYIQAIQIEQSFLSLFDRYYVISVLANYNSEYRDMLENICGIVLMNTVGHIAVNKPFHDACFLHEEYLELSEIFKAKPISDIENIVKNFIEKMVRRFYKDNADMLEYLCCETNNIATRIYTANQYGELSKVFVL